MSSKTKKSSGKKKTSKSKPNLEFSCKFRGKYDLSKNKRNSEISLENAISLFKVLYKKNENLYKNTHIKMHNEKKTFSFSLKKSLSKIHHHVPYVQVKKFYVLHKDPTMVIMGVHHNVHRWFLVFQFSNAGDLTRFCDEIEGDKKQSGVDRSIESPYITDVDFSPSFVPEIQIDGEVRGDSPTFEFSDFERHSIHSELFNEFLKVDDSNFDDSYYEPDLEAENYLSQSSFLEDLSPSFCSSRASSSNSSDSDHDKLYCDNVSQTKLKYLLIQSDNMLYQNIDQWDEQLTCMEYPNGFNEPHLNKVGPVYIYVARHKVNILSTRSMNYSDSYSSDDEDKHGFRNFEPKISRNDRFNDYAPKMIQKDKDKENFYNHEPKMIQKENEKDNFRDHEPKMIQKENEKDNFRDHDPKMIQKENEKDNFRDHEPKMIQKENEKDNFHHHDPKMI